MDVFEAIQQRHSVRKYTDRPIEGDVLARLEAEIAACNEEGGLHIQLVTEEPEAFGTGLFKYGQFKGVRNYLCFIGPDTPELDEKVGYYGERVVLLAQQLGLNSCWVALTFNKRKARYELREGERLVLVASVGYGESQGSAHKVRDIAKVSNVSGKTPPWFEQGVSAALLAPTAMNQQKFTFTYEPVDGGGLPVVYADAPRGHLTKVDLGIAKYHFEVVAGKENFEWGAR